jgi:hypothetical protein
LLNKRHQSWTIHSKQTLDGILEWANKEITNPSPQEVDTNHQPIGSTAACNLGSPTVCSLGSPTACKDPPPLPTNMPFNPMAFLKGWGEKMQMMHQHQPQTIVVESRANKSCKSEAKFNKHMLQLLLVAGNVNFAPPNPLRYHRFRFTHKLC